MDADLQAPSGKNYRQRRFEQDKAFLAELAAAFPDCFTQPGAPRKPLKIGIDADIIARLDAPRGRVARVLFHYTGQSNYLDVLVEGASRVDLDGDPSGTVNAAQAKEAARRSLGITAARAMSEANHRLQRAVDAVAACLRRGDDEVTRKTVAAVATVAAVPDDQAVVVVLTAGTIRAVLASASGEQ